ncbi:MAG: hypothetical protein LBG11_06900 [Bifidobacteriaceae bacterium]|jgi:hypothetical protein|nr:hypothetical protein [Bifidobacteriaceae bacterium]
MNGTVCLRVPTGVVRTKAQEFLKGGVPQRVAALQPLDDHTIVGWSGARDRGIVNYYKLAGNIHVLGRLRWVLQTSMLKTLASKHRSTVTKTAAKHRAKVITRHGPRTCFEARLDRSPRPPLTSRFGEVPLRRDKTARIVDPGPQGLAHPRKEIVRRIQRGRCEWCGAKRVGVEVHQVRGLASLDPNTEVGQIMLAMRRKTPVVCRACHERIDPGQTSATSPPLESRVR